MQRCPPLPRLLASAALGLAILCSALAVRAADRFVSTGGADAGSDCLAAPAPCRTVGHALGEAASGDTLKVAAGTYGETALVIASSIILTVSGGWTEDFAARDPIANPSVLDGQRLDGIFEVEAGTGESIDLTLDGLTMTRARGAGGAMLASTLDDGTLTLAFNGCTLRKNGGGNAGAVFASAQNTSILDVSFTDSTLVRNTIGIAGGIRLFSGDTSALSLTLVRTVLGRNQGFLGAGILAESAGTGTMDVMVVDSLLTRNRPRVGTSGEGGGIWASAFGGTTNVVLTNTRLLRNRAGAGGGILARGEAVDLTLTNSTITGNRTRHIPDAPSTGTGGGILLSGARSATLTNTIVWGNRSRTGKDLYMAEGVLPLTVDADHSDLGEVVTVSGTFNDVGGNIDTDPHLSVSDGRLSAGSPAIDAGTCAGVPATDFEGDPRPTGVGCDMGADEFVP